MFYRMATPEEEVVLCTIRIDSGGVVSIHPDFNRGRKAYIAESNKDYGRGTVSRCIRKPAFYMCKNKDTDQLRSTADQCLFSLAIDITIFLLPKSQISDLVICGFTARLCQTWSETQDRFSCNTAHSKFCLSGHLC